MKLAKKLTFAPLLLIVFAALVYQLSFLLADYNLILSFSGTALIYLIVISALISISSLLFSLFATIASDWKLTLPVGIICSAIPFIFAPSALALIFAVAIFVSFLLTHLNLDIALKTYLTFQSASILGPSIRHLSSLLILSFSVVYFFSASQTIAQKGFQIPDELIDTALQVASPNLPDTANSQNLPQLSISKEQIEFLKKNPELLEQSGLNPKILDTLDQTGQQPITPAQVTNDLIKQTVKDQLQNSIKPYLNFIPAGLAILLFLTLQSLVSIINLLVYPLLWIIFYILEKTGFVKFTQEMRPVKKMVV